MALRRFILIIVAIIKRLELSRSARYRQMFVELAPIFIGMQDRRAQSVSDAKLIAPYRSYLEHLVRHLAWVREARPTRSRRLLRLPRGCRIGKLHFSPLLQLAKLLGDESITHVTFEPLPRTRRQLLDHYLKRIGLDGHASEPAGFKTLFGFELSSYVAQLMTLRRADPVSFMMLAANEFVLAQEWAEGRGSPVDATVRQGAIIAELERLLEIVSFVEDHPESHAQLRDAVRVLAQGDQTKCSEETLEKHRLLQRHIDWLGLGVEALRALFLGDQAKGPLGLPLAAASRWSATTVLMRRVGVTRCAWFANDQDIQVRGFRQPRMRFVRSRRWSAYTYHGIPLDALLVVGIKDLSSSVGRAGGIHAVNDLAGTIWQTTMNQAIDFDRLARQAKVFSKTYLRDSGRGGSNARFTPAGWFDSQADEALYGRLWRIFVDGRNRTSAASLRYQMRSAIRVLSELLTPFWKQQMPVDPGTASQVVAQLACGLTPLSMDPIFAALVERELVEQMVPVNFRKHASVARSKHTKASERLLPYLMNRAFRSEYARFEGVDERLNHDPGATCLGQQINRMTMPRVAGLAVHSAAALPP